MNNATYIIDHILNENEHNSIPSLLLHSSMNRQLELSERGQYFVPFGILLFGIVPVWLVILSYFFCDERSNHEEEQQHEHRDHSNHVTKTQRRFILEKILSEKYQINSNIDATMNSLSSEEDSSSSEGNSFTRIDEENSVPPKDINEISSRSLNNENRDDNNNFEIYNASVENRDCELDALEKQETTTIKTPTKVPGIDITQIQDCTYGRKSECDESSLRIVTPKVTKALRIPLGIDDMCTEEEEDLCAICLSTYKQDENLIVSKSCTHKFHKDCILKWLEDHNECPICRVDMITKNEISLLLSLN